eukprot:471003_1
MGTEYSQQFYKLCCGDSNSATDLKPTNKPQYKTFLQAIRNGDIKHALQYGNQHEICNFMPLISAILAQIPHGTQSYRDELLKLFQKRCEKNIFLSQSFHCFLYSYFNESYVKTIWNKHPIYQYIITNDINLIIEHETKNEQDTSPYNTKQKFDKQKIRNERQKKIMHRIYKSSATNFRFTKAQKSILQADIERQMTVNQIEYAGTNVIELFEIFCMSQSIDDANHEIEIKPGFKVEIINCDKFCDPINGELNLKTIQCESIFNSNTKPLLLSFYNVSAKLTSKTIFKKGDDLRKDSSILMMFRLFNDIWSCNNLKYNKRMINIFTYKCVPISEYFGCIEYIENCVSLTNIKKHFDDEKFMKDKKWIDKFIASAVGSYIGAYVMGIRDRHSDNILIKKNGFLFHIDYGYVLGDKLSGLDAASFSITNDLKYIMGNVNWNDFVDRCIDAFKVLRDNYDDIISFAKIAITFVEWKKVEYFLSKRLMIEESSNKMVEQHIRDKIVKAPNKWKTKMKNKIHSIAVNVKKSS